MAVKFGLKAKTLIVLSSILLVVILGNLLFTNMLIIEDKKAYIFENILLNTEDVKRVINENVRSSLFQAETIGQLSKANSPGLKETFDKQEAIEGLSLSWVDQNHRPIKLKRNAFPNKTESHSDFVADWLDQTIPQDGMGLKVKKIEGKDEFEVRLKDGVKNLGMLIDMSDLWNRISNDHVFNYLILNGSGEVLWKTGEDSFLNSRSDLLKGEKNSTAREISVNGTSYLMSISSIPELDINVVCYIPSSKAFAVVGQLSMKTVAFGLVLLGVSALLGVVFSNRLTNPIRALMEGVLYVGEGNFTHKVKVETKDELFVLGEKFNFMSGKIKDLLDEKEVIIQELKDANAKIEDYSKNLELKVEERTRELKSANDFIQAMINSLDQGLFVFGPDLVCSPVYTKACENLFRKSPGGLRFEEVLDLPSDKKAMIPQWADIVFNEKIPFDSATQLGVLDKHFGTPESDDYRVLKLHYHPMREESGSISNLVVVATDKTDEIRAIEESRRQERYVKMIFKILSSKKHFLDFTQEVDEYLKNLDGALSSNEPQLDTAMLIYHSFTGGFGVYAVDSLVHEARACEESIVNMKKGGAIDRKVLLEGKNSFEKKYWQFKEETFNTLGFNSSVVEINQSVILELNTLVQNSGKEDLKQVFNEKILKVPLEDYFTPYKHLLDSLAPRLGKEIAPLTVEGGDIRLRPERFREFFSLLVHLFRNCADHGIEAPYAREEKGKTPEGKILVRAQLENEGKMLRLIIADDGGGIDPERIRAKLSKTSVTSEPDEEVIYHIFDKDFSTAEQVTAISGRGVGMSAIKDVVERLNGKIKLESKVGQGTQFIFELPT